MTEIRYKTSSGDAVTYRDGDGKPSLQGQYLAGEAHSGFYSVAWSTPLTLAGALERFLVAKPPRGQKRRRATQAIVIDSGGVRKMSAATAITRARLRADGIHLLRLEYPGYTFVWRGPLDDDGEGLAEIGLMCAQRDDAFIEAIVRDTATEGLAAQASDLVGKVAAKIH